MGWLREKTTADSYVSSTLVINSVSPYLTYIVYIHVALEKPSLPVFYQNWKLSALLILSSRETGFLSMYVCLTKVAACFEICLPSAW